MTLDDAASVRYIYIYIFAMRDIVIIQTALYNISHVILFTR